MLKSSTRTVELLSIQIHVTNTLYAESILNINVSIMRLTFVLEIHATIL